MTQNTEERTLLNSIRFAIVAVPSLIISLATPYLKSGTQESNSTYGNIALVFAVIATVCTLICVAGIVERAKAPTARQRTSGKEYFKAILKNRQLLVVSAAFFCRTLGYYIYSSSMAYYFNYYLGSAKLMGIILGISAPISAVAALCVTPVSRYMGKKKALMGCGVIFALSSVIRYFMPLNTAVVAVTCWIGMFVMSATLAIFFTMIADTTDYGMWLTGKNVRAVNYGFYTFCQKIGMAFSGTIVGILLDMAGYVPNQQQTDAALRGILNSIILCLAGNCITQYNTPDRLSAEQSDIKFLYGAYPIRYPFLIYFKTEIIKNIRRIFESEMTVNIPVKMITCRILHAFIQFDKLRVLRRHIDLNIRGDPFALVCEPFDKACIF